MQSSRKTKYARARAVHGVLRPSSSLPTTAVFSYEAVYHRTPYGPHQNNISDKGSPMVAAMWPKNYPVGRDITRKFWNMKAQVLGCKGPCFG